MSMIWQFLIDPFLSFGFMRKALIGCVLLSFGAAPLGVMLSLRQMSLMGDAMAHAVLPGVAVGFLLSGASIPMMSLGGFIAGIFVVMLSALASRSTLLKEDTNLAAFYLMAMAFGVMLIALRGNAVDLMHLLFGSVLAVERDTLLLMAGVTSVTLVIFALFYRAFLVEAFDPVFLRSVSRAGPFYHLLFLVLVVLNLVAGFQAMGTLMAVGLMMIPAAAARFWAREFAPMVGIAVLVGCCASFAGLCLSFAIDVPSGPAIILFAGLMYLASLLCGRWGSVRARYFPFRHLEQ